MQQLKVMILVWGRLKGLGPRNRRAKEGFYFKYLYHSPDEQRWFMMHVTSFTIAEGSHYVVSYQNITQRKLAEE